MYSTGVADSEDKEQLGSLFISVQEKMRSLWNLRQRKLAGCKDEVKACGCRRWKRGNHPSAYGICEKESCGAGDSSWKP